MYHNAMPYHWHAEDKRLSTPNKVTSHARFSSPRDTTPPAWSAAPAHQSPAETCPCRREYCSSRFSSPKDYRSLFTYYNTLLAASTARVHFLPCRPTARTRGAVSFRWRRSSAGCCRCWSYGAPCLSAGFVWEMRRCGDVADRDLSGLTAGDVVVEGAAGSS
jgi:hypothetical protein